MIRKSKGFVWTALLPYVGLFAALALGLWYAVSTVYEKGEKAERLKWEATQAKLAEDSTKAVLELKAENHALEKSRYEYAANLTASLNNRIKQNENDGNRVIDTVRTGDIKLRVSTKSAAVCDSGASGIGASLSRDNGASGAELSDEAAQFFITEAIRANRVVLQLTACQAQLSKDRDKLINAFSTSNPQSTGDLK